jgi:hypothetical protein
MPGGAHALGTRASSQGPGSKSRKGFSPIRQNRPVARLCIFCGAVQVTAEHIWPRSAQKYLLVREPQQHTRTIQAAGEDPVRQEYLKRPYDATARVVCSTCNSGWMSRLETRAKPLLPELMGGHEVPLRGAAQHLPSA